MSVFLRGAVIGFSIAAPVGPIGLLCIRRSLAEGRWVGLFTGLGAATADAVYGGIAVFGLTAVSSVLVAYRVWLALFGGLFLSFVAIFAGLGLASGADYRGATLLVAGVFAGSAVWWLTLSSGSGTALLRTRLSAGWMRLLNHLSGAMILAFGIDAIATAFRR